jgi:TonB family protein
MSTAALSFSDRLSGAWPDPEEEAEGRTVSLEELFERLRNRPDIFGIERNNRLRNAELLALIIAVLAGMWAASRERLPEIGRDQPGGSHPPLPSIVTFKHTAVENPFAQNRPNPPPSHSPAHRHAAPGSLRPVKSSGSRLAGLMNRGVLSLLSRLSQVSGVVGDPSGKGGVFDPVTAVLAGGNGIRHGSSLHSDPTRNVRGFDFGPDAGVSGERSDGVTIDNLIDNLRQSKETGVALVSKTRPPPVLAKGVLDADHAVPLLSGSRKKSDIMRVVMENMAALRYAYSRRLRDNPALRGKVTVRFAIDEFGRVIRCEIVESSLNDKELESALVGRVTRWRFDPIDDPGNITEVLYPFVFSS